MGYNVQCMYWINTLNPTILCVCVCVCVCTCFVITFHRLSH